MKCMSWAIMPSNGTCGGRSRGRCSGGCLGAMLRDFGLHVTVGLLDLGCNSKDTYDRVLWNQSARGRYVDGLLRPVLGARGAAAGAQFHISAVSRLYLASAGCFLRDTIHVTLIFQTSGHICWCLLAEWEPSSGVSPIRYSTQVARCTVARLFTSTISRQRT
jgi:hypothetical protein